MQKLTINTTLSRRLLAFFYDILLLLGVLFAVSAVSVAINKGEAVTHPVYYLSLVLTAFVFFGWFWTHGGQTLGMRTWKIKIIGNESDDVSWKQSAIRFVSALVVFLPTMTGLFWLFFNSERRLYAMFALIPALLGLLWLLLDKNKLAWHDKLSATHLINLKAKEKTDNKAQSASINH